MLGEQICLRVAGVGLRVDFLVAEPDGRICVVESQYGPSAGFTPNQAVAHDSPLACPKPMTFANSADGAAVEDLVGRAPSDLGVAQLVRWEGAPGSLRMTVADIQRIAGDFREVDSLRGSPPRLLATLDGLHDVGAP